MDYSSRMGLTIQLLMSHWSILGHILENELCEPDGEDGHHQEGHGDDLQEA